MNSTGYVPKNSVEIVKYVDTFWPHDCPNAGTSCPTAQQWSCPHEANTPALGHSIPCYHSADAR